MKAIKSPHSPKQVAQFEAWYEEGYDVEDDTYLAWKSTYIPSY